MNFSIDQLVADRYFLSGTGQQVFELMDTMKVYDLYTNEHMRLADLSDDAYGDCVEAIEYSVLCQIKGYRSGGYV